MKYSGNCLDDSQATAREIFREKLLKKFSKELLDEFLEEFMKNYSMELLEKLAEEFLIIC